MKRQSARRPQHRSHRPMLLERGANEGGSPPITEVAPQRLREFNSPAGELLRRLPGTPGGTPATFSSLLATRRRRRKTRVAALSSLVLAAGIIALTLQRPGPLIQAEPTERYAAARPAPSERLAHSNKAPQHALASQSFVHAEAEATLAHPVRAPTTRSQRSPTAGQVHRPESLSSPAPPAPDLVAAQLAQRVAPGALIDSPSEATHSSADCGKLARQGAIAEASSCYGVAAQGSGTSAELALIEHARLQARVKGDNVRALDLLDSYFERFKKGGLLPEAKLMQLNLLAQAGRQEQLLRELAGTLSANLLPERRGQLLSIQAETLAHVGQCQKAQRVAVEADQALHGNADAPTVRKVTPLCGNAPASEHTPPRD